MIAEMGVTEKRVNEICESLMIERDAKIARLEAKVRTLEIQHETSLVFRQLLMRKIDDQEQYSRKTHLIMDGFDITRNMNDEDIKQLVIDEIRRLKLKITPDQVDRAHRHESQFTDKKGKRHTPIVCRFVTWTARDTFYNARKQSSVYVKADLTDRRHYIFMKAREQIEDSQLHESIQHIYVDRNCKLTAISDDGRHVKFSSLEEFERLPTFIDFTSETASRAVRELRFMRVERVEAVGGADERAAAVRAVREVVAGATATEASETSEADAPAVTEVETAAVSSFAEAAKQPPGRKSSRKNTK